MKSWCRRFGILGELVIFLWYRKFWWMIPMMVVLVLFGLLSIRSDESKEVIK